MTDTDGRTNSTKPGGNVQPGNRRSRRRTRRRPAINWQETDLQFIPRPTCPACGSPTHRFVRSEAGGDGSTVRKLICECGEPFRVCLEYPDPVPLVGNDDNDVL